MDDQFIKSIVLEFMEWVDEHTYKSIEGYCLYENNSPEFQFDELYDYWYKNIYQSPSK